MTIKGDFDPAALTLDCALASRQIEKWLSRTVSRRLRRRGVVIGVSGGVDSAVCAALAVRALGSGRVFGLIMPERDVSSESTERARAMCDVLGIDYRVEDITSVLDALGCYRSRDEAARELFPDYGAGYRQKIALAGGLLDRDRLNYFELIIESPTGIQQRKRMPVNIYLQIVAATNMKQRTRKQLEYFHAERLNYAVLGTPNRLEYELGFFVRGGDGLADIKPIAHLYKTQVYALAQHLEIAKEIRSQAPSTGTYSLPQSQNEFYFALPYEQLDLLLYAFLQGFSPDETGRVLGLQKEQVERVYRDIVSKRRWAGRNLQDAILFSNGDKSECAT